LFRRSKGDAIGSQDFDLLLMIRHGLARQQGKAPPAATPWSVYENSTIMIAESFR
jgi:hypothetical protein